VPFVEYDILKARRNLQLLGLIWLEQGGNYSSIRTRVQWRARLAGGDRYSTSKEIYEFPSRENFAISPRARRIIPSHSPRLRCVKNNFGNFAPFSFPLSSRPQSVSTAFRPRHRKGNVFSKFPASRANESFAHPVRKSWKIYEREREREGEGEFGEFHEHYR